MKLWVFGVLWRGQGSLTMRFPLTPFCEIPDVNSLLYHLLFLPCLAIKVSEDLPFLRAETPVRKESGGVFQCRETGRQLWTCC